MLCYVGLYCHVDAYLARRGMRGTKPADLPSLRDTLREGWPFLIVLAFLVYGLLALRWERLAPYYTALLLLWLGLFKQSLRIDRARLRVILVESAKLLSQTMGLMLPTSFILGGLMATGVAPAIAAELVQMGSGSVVPILAIGIGVCVIFGMVGLIVAAYLMLALTLAPALEQAAGLNTLAIHLFIAYYATLAAITPPVALAAFLASRISDSGPIKTSMHAARLGIVLYFIPIFFLFVPALILQGHWVDTVVWVSFNLVAIVLIAAASEGYLVRFGRLRGWARVVLFVAWLLIGFPEWVSTAVGIAMAVAVIAMRRHALDGHDAAGAVPAIVT